MKIGFIGLGLMGEGMAANIAKKNEEITYVYDINPNKVAVLKALGAEPLKSVKEITELSDVVITMVPNSTHVKSVYSEALQYVKNGQIFIDMSTIDPNVSIELSKTIKEKGATMLDAPVVKSRPAALAGNLGIYVGGEKKIFDKVKYILEYMGGNEIIYLGENGLGLIMKIAHNMLVAEIQNGVNETISFAKSYGISEDDYGKAISYGGGDNFYLNTKLNAIKNRDYTTAFSVENMNKDINIAISLLNKNNKNYPGIKLVQKLYSQAVKEGNASKDFSYLYEIVENNK